MSLNREILLCFHFRHFHSQILHVTSRPTGYNFVCLGHDISQFLSNVSWFFSVPEISFLIALKIIPWPLPSAFIQCNETIGQTTNESQQSSISLLDIQCCCFIFLSSWLYIPSSISTKFSADLDTPLWFRTPPPPPPLQFPLKTRKDFAGGNCCEHSCRKN